jgi:hypothetical protein
MSSNPPLLGGDQGSLSVHIDIPSSSRKYVFEKKEDQALTPQEAEQESDPAFIEDDVAAADLALLPEDKYSVATGVVTHITPSGKEIIERLPAKELHFDTTLSRFLAHGLSSEEETPTDSKPVEEHFQGTVDSLSFVRLFLRIATHYSSFRTRFMNQQLSAPLDLLTLLTDESLEPRSIIRSEPSYHARATQMTSIFLSKLKVFMLILFACYFSNFSIAFSQICFYFSKQFTRFES